MTDPDIAADADERDLVIAYNDKGQFVHSFIPFFEPVQAICRIFNGGWCVVSRKDLVKIYSS